MRKYIQFLIVLALIIGVIPVLAITITDQGTLSSWGWTGTPPNQVYDETNTYGTWLTICGEPGDTASFEIDYSVTDSSCHFISAGLLIVGQGPVSVYNEPVHDKFTTYHDEIFPESGRIDFAARLLCIIPLIDPDNPYAPPRRIEADYELTAYAPGDGECETGEKITICHIPQGNKANAHTISIDRESLTDHLNHGDTVGACTGD